MLVLVSTDVRLLSLLAIPACDGGSGRSCQIRSSIQILFNRTPLRDVADVAYDYDSVRIRWSAIVLSAREPVNSMCRI